MIDIYLTEFQRVNLDFIYNFKKMHNILVYLGAAICRKLSSSHSVSSHPLYFYVLVSVKTESIDYCYLRVPISYHNFHLLNIKINNGPGTLINNGW